MTVIRSNRKTISLHINPDGSLTVKAPLQMSSKQIDAFIISKKEWIAKAQERMKSRQQEQGSVDKLTLAEMDDLFARAKEYIPQRVSFYSHKLKVKYGRITIRCQRTRWGSCSVKGNLNFNCLLMLAPDEVIDSVVVHELCHIKQMNHSRQFYQEIKSIFPEYDKWNKWLKENGAFLLARVPGKGDL